MAVEVRFGFHGKRDAVALEIDFHDGDLDFLADFDDFRGVSHKLVGELGNVDESVLMDADILAAAPPRSRRSTFFPVSPPPE